MDKNYQSIKHGFTNKQALLQKKTNFWQNRRVQYGPLALGLILLGTSLWFLIVYLNFYQQRFFAHTKIDEIDISGLTQAEAIDKIRKNQQWQIDLGQDELRFFHQNYELKAKLSDLGVNDNLTAVVEQTFAIGHRGSWWQKTVGTLQAHWQAPQANVGLTSDQGKIQTLIDNFKKQVELSGKKPAVKVQGQTIEVFAGEAGEEMSVAATSQQIQNQIFSRSLRELRQTDLNIPATIVQTNFVLDQAQVEQVHKRAQKLLSNQLTLTYDYQRIKLTDADLIKLLGLPEGIDQTELDNKMSEIKQQVNRPSRDAVFRYDPDTLKVQEFQAEQSGIELNIAEAQKIITDFITTAETSEQALQKTIALPMQNSTASVTLASSNNLGIKEVIGFGESWYDHSIPNRIHNVGIATNRISNHIVKPDEQFSFNQVLGEVSDRTGYRSAYVIEGGQTKLSPGGGVCQVSSTLFRSLLNAGVQITRRLPHAYRVSYYEIGNEPGFDATVYAGDVDLRFINDTPAHILIHCEANSDKLYMYCKLYGTSDGRSTEIVNYKKWGATGPLPTVYIPDPSLRPGQLKQIDWSAGGIKAEFTNIVRDKDGKVLRQDNYFSNYRPWAASICEGFKFH